MNDLEHKLAQLERERQIVIFEAELLEKMRGIIPIPDFFLAHSAFDSYQPCVRMIYRFPILTYMTDTAEEAEGEHKYRFPSVSVRVDPYQVRDKLIQILGEPMLLYQGTAASTFYLGTDWHRNYYDQKEQHVAIPWRPITNYYFDVKFADDAKTNESAYSSSYVSSISMRMWFESPIEFNGRNLPYYVQIESLPSDFGVETYRPVTKSIQTGTGMKHYYGHSKALMKDDPGWVWAGGAGYLYRPL